jgi:hypothetical protein
MKKLLFLMLLILGASQSFGNFPQIQMNDPAMIMGPVADGVVLRGAIAGDASSAFGSQQWTIPGPYRGDYQPDFFANVRQTLTNTGEPVGDQSTDPLASVPFTSHTIDAGYTMASAGSFPLWIGQLNPQGNFANQWGNNLFESVFIWLNGTPQIPSFTMKQLEVTVSDTRHYFDQTIVFDDFSVFPEFSFFAQRADGLFITHLAANGTPQDLVKLWWAGPSISYLVQGGGTAQQQVALAHSAFSTPDVVTTTFNLWDPTHENVLWSTSATETLVAPELDVLVLLACGACFISLLRPRPAFLPTR